MKRFGLLGYPLGHSLSPLIFQSAFQHCGLQGEYNLIPIPPEEPQQLSETLEEMRRGALDGLNITIPFKQRVMPLLDEVTSTAHTIGAVNLIYKEGDRLIGDNSDAAGFTTDLSRFIDIDTTKSIKSALVLGAGGAARAIVYALAACGWRVTIAARRVSQAAAIIADFKSAFAQIAALELSSQEIGAGSQEWQLIVNCTPVGMHPLEDASPWPAGVPFPAESCIVDLVYNPRETCLLRDARSAGLMAISGIGMLVEQAALAFKIWTGREFSREAVYATLEYK